MKGRLRLVAKLYPRAWRERYGEEFHALLDDTGADARTAFDVFKGAIRMQIERRKKKVSAAALLAAAICAASWWAGQRPYISPGTHGVLYMDSTFAAMLGLAIMIAAAAGGMAFVVLHDLGRFSAAARVGRASAGAFMAYVAAVAVVSLLTPRTIVSIGDGYCYDTWCIGVERVSATTQGQSILYTADVRIFSDANRAPATRDRDFLYVLDEQGRRYALDPDLSFTAMAGDKLTVDPGESVQTAVTFRASANARKLYLTGDYAVMPWVPLCFGSDISPLHRRTLLRVL